MPASGRPAARAPLGTRCRPGAEVRGPGARYPAAQPGRASRGWGGWVAGWVGVSVRGRGGRPPQRGLQTGRESITAESLGCTAMALTGLGEGSHHAPGMRESKQLLHGARSPCVAGTPPSRRWRSAAERSPSGAPGQVVPRSRAAAALQGSCPAALPTGCPLVHGHLRHGCRAPPSLLRSAQHRCCPAASSRHAGSWRCRLAKGGLRPSMLPIERPPPDPRLPPPPAPEHQAAVPPE